MVPLKPILRLRDLTIIDLQIDISESPLANYEDLQNVKLTELETLGVRDLEPFRVKPINFRDVEWFEPVDTILSAVGMKLKSTTITRCVTSYVNDFYGRLYLEGIVKDNIWQLLQCWYGQELYVSRCPGFTDYTLADIGDRHADCAPNLHTLVISDCSNISTEGLKQLVGGRRRIPLKKLFVSGKVPQIKWKDQLWFTKALHHFDYRGPELDPDSGSGSGSTVNSNGSGTDSDDSVYDSDALVSDTSSSLTNYSL
jgi:hypothetical protein